MINVGKVGENFPTVSRINGRCVAEAVEGLKIRRGQVVMW